MFVDHDTETPPHTSKLAGDYHEMRKRLKIGSYKTATYVRAAFALGEKIGTEWLFSEEELAPFLSSVPFATLRTSAVYPGSADRWKHLKLDGDQAIDMYAASAYTGWGLGWACAKTPKDLRQMAKMGIIGTPKQKDYVFTRREIDALMASETPQAKQEKEQTPSHTKAHMHRDPLHWQVHNLDPTEPLTTEKAAKYIGVSRQHIANQAQLGLIGVRHPYSNRYLYTRRELDAFFGLTHLPARERVSPEMRVQINTALDMDAYNVKQVSAITGLSREAIYKAYERGDAGRKHRERGKQPKIYFSKADIEALLKVKEEDIPLKVSRYAFTPVPSKAPIREGGWVVQANNIGKVLSIREDKAFVRWLERGTHHEHGIVVELAVDTLKSIEEPRMNIALTSKVSSLGLAELREANARGDLGELRQPFWITPSELTRIEKQHQDTDAD